MNLPPLYLLQALAAFSKYGTVAGAAAGLQATQPTVTRQLQQLEGMSSAPLFETRGRNKVLTEYGRTIAETFERHFRQFELEAQRTHQNMNDPASQVLRIGARREILLGYFSGLEFTGRLELLPMGSAAIASEIGKQSLDIAVTQSAIDTDAYIAKPLFTSQATLLMPKRWSAEMPAYADVAVLCEKHSYCTFSIERPYMEQFAADLKLNAPAMPHTTVNDWIVVEDRVHRGLAWSLVPSNIARQGRNYWRVKLPESVGRQTFNIYVRRSLSRVAWFREVLSKVHKGQRLS